MNEELIRRWNSVVTPEDTVVHGGDFALCNKEVATHICHSLNGHKVLVRGNHDGNTRRMLDIGFDVVVENYFNDGILVNHYPNRVRQEYYDLCNIFLYGHVHSKIPHNKPLKGINISCEVLDYTPRTIEELKTIYLSRQEPKGFVDSFDPIPKSVRNEYNAFKNLERDIDRKEKLKDDEE